jgi:hypothetical protein
VLCFGICFGIEGSLERVCDLRVTAAGPFNFAAAAVARNFCTCKSCLKSEAMKLDVNVLRYLSKEDFRVLTAVEMGQKNVSWVPESSACCYRTSIKFLHVYVVSAARDRAHAAHRQHLRPQVSSAAMMLPAAVAWCVRCFICLHTQGCWSA